MGTRLVACGASLSLLSGCLVLYDGGYQVRGTVRQEANGALVPVPGASVVVPPNKHSFGATTTTRDDGTYSVEYRFFGGGLFPFGFFSSDDGDPDVEASAPGFPACRAKASPAGLSSCAWKRPCVLPDHRGRCIIVDLVLGALASDRIDPLEEVFLRPNTGGPR